MTPGPLLVVKLVRADHCFGSTSVLSLVVSKRRDKIPKVQREARRWNAEKARGTMGPSNKVPQHTN